MTTPPQHNPDTAVRYCGREFTPADLDTVRALAASLPTRARIAEAAAAALGWRRPDGQTKAMSARVALNRMAADGLVVLPPPRNTNGNGRIPRYHDAAQPGLFDADPAPTGPLTTTLAALGPLHPRPVSTPAENACYRHLIATHHYLGYTPLPGAQLRYLVHTTSHGVAAALGFAASAWKCAARDTHIGWDTPIRQAHLHLVVGNARFLIPPHLRVPHLASAALAATTRRLAADWRAAYGYTPVLAETFVETPRFTGTSYRAANWTHVGTTTGRGKLDRHHTHALPVKDVYLYPLHRAWRAILTTTP
jgi:Domain of unknown function (DUF4338)